MTDFVMTLGGVDFQEFEVPESIRAGGRQALSIHKYPGGLRTIDTTGPDDDSLAWSGFFEDGDAEQRCQQLDAMRRQGLPVMLTWSSYSYVVVIETFEWDYKRFYHIGYSISLAVVQDQTQPGSDGAPDIESQMQGDIGDALSDAQGFIGGVQSGLAAAVGTIQDTVATVNSITGGSIGFLNTLQGQIGTASAIANGVLDTADAALSEAGAAANFVAGTPPLTMIANVTALSAAASAMPLAFDAANKLARLGKNVAAVIG